MTSVLAGVAIAVTVWFVTRTFDLKVLVLAGALPFEGWAQAHLPSVPWSMVVSGLVAIVALAAVRERPAPSPDGAAFGLTAVVLAFAAVAAAQSFSPDLPSVVVGLRGARLVLEPVIFYFIGAEVARRPPLLRRLLIVVAATGAVVAVYALKQWLLGYDGREIALYRRTFPVALRERRIFSTMPGASALGHELGLVSLVAGAWLFKRGRWWPIAAALLGSALVGVLLTGQRGVQLAVIAAGTAGVTLALLRPASRAHGARAAQLLTVVVGLTIGLALATPVQDRRHASSPSGSALSSARIKLALLRKGGQETSAGLREQRLNETAWSLTVRPLGAGTGLNLLVDPSRSRRTTFLGDAGLRGTATAPVAPRPGELYFYTLASELGIPGLALWCALALYGLAAGAAVALRHPDPVKATIALVACGYVVLVVADSFSVDAMTALPVAAWFWLFLGIVGRWVHEVRER